MTSKPTKLITQELEDIRARLERLAVERVHEYAISALAALRGLSRAEKRLALQRADKLLDA